MTTTADPNETPKRDDRARIPDDQPAPHVERRETHQTSEVPLGSGDRPEAPGSGGDSARTTHRIPAVRERNESGRHRGPDPDTGPGHER
ncbi:MAG TPA: hypothetical protein VL689_19190 [Paraburkholderia sp.]|jgi:hypothetical protein|nr:hypothetical protein [Paraburkholderia sp.]